MPNTSSGLAKPVFIAGVLGIVAGRGDRPRRVFAVADVGKPLGHLDAVGAPLLVDFVADAPQNDARMVAVAVDHADQIPLAPVVERTARSRSLVLFFFHSSNASSITKKPIRSQRSSNSGAGGLWLVRMALQPIVLRISSCRSMARRLTADPRQPKS